MAATPGWGGQAEINNPSSSSNFDGQGFDLIPHKDSLYALCNGGNDVTPATAETEVYGMRVTTDGVTWTDAGGTGFPDSNTTNEYILSSDMNSGTIRDRGRLLSFGNRLVAAIFRDSASPDGDGLIEVLSSTDNAANWASDVTIPSGDGPKALVDWFDLAGSRSIVLVTAEGVYSIDAANDTFELIYELDGDPNNGRWAVVGNDGALWLGLGSGELIRLAITDTGHLDIITAGPPGDGFVTARQGFVTFLLKTPSEWLFVAYGGNAANKDASIFKINTQTPQRDPETGKLFFPWYHVYQHGTSNKEIRMLAYSTEDDATPRLHMSILATTGAGGSDTIQHIALPLTNPKSSTAIKYKASGILRKPVDDLGDPHTNSNITQALVDADDLSATNSDEFIEHQFGLNGAVDTTVTLGEYLSGTKTLNFGSGKGVSAKKIGNRYNFNRGSTNTNTPKLQESEIQSYHHLLGRLAWDFTIDIDKTAEDNAPAAVVGQTIAETIIAAIKTVVASVPLVTFTIAQETQTNVRIPNDRPPIFNLTTINASGAVLGDRTGFITVRVEEGI